MTASTFPDLLADQVRRSGSRPLVTFYDDASGERAELSVVTFANWVAKTAGLAQDELGLERGDTVLVDLPTHWLAPVWLGACWSAGLVVTSDPAADSSLVVCGPHGLERHAGSGRPVVALSLLPMGRRFATPLPSGVVDFGVAVWGQPDSFLADDPPGPDDAAWAGPPERSQAELLSHAGRLPWATPGTRLLTDVPPASEHGVDAFLAPLAAGGGTVWVARPIEDAWQRHAEAERVTVEHATGAP